MHDCDIDKLIQGSYMPEALDQTLEDKLLRQSTITLVSSTKRRKYQRIIAMAAVIVVVVGSVLQVESFLRNPRHILIDEIQQQVTEAATAAELLVATQILAECSNTEAIVQEQYRHIRQKYPNAPVIN